MLSCQLPAALTQLVMPFTLIKQQLLQVSKTSGRSRRSLPEGSFDGGVYKDDIGVPRGVPEKIKARNQILARLESSIFWWSTLKIVDWINYIYYNQQRFINHFRDATKGLAEKTAAPSLMAWLLAEKGGVCVMFGSICCTFIPNNTDGWIRD